MEIVEIVNWLADKTEAIVIAFTVLMYKVALPLLGIVYAATKLTPTHKDDNFVKRWLDRFRKAKTTLNE